MFVANKFLPLIFSVSNIVYSVIWNTVFRLQVCISFYYFKKGRSVTIRKFYKTHCCFGAAIGFATMFFLNKFPNSELSMMKRRASLSYLTSLKISIILNALFLHTPCIYRCV